MEERLAQFVEGGAATACLGAAAGDYECAGALHFVHTQVIKLAADCLQRSKDKLISSAYFYELSENLQTLLYDVRHRLSTLNNNYMTLHTFCIALHNIHYITLHNNYVY